MSADGSFGLSLLQHAPTPLDVDASLARLDRAAADAAAVGSNLLVVPECSLSGYNVAPEDARRVAATASGEGFERVAAVCRRHRVAVLRAFVERDGERLRNAAQLIDADGTARALYRKTHLWGELDRTLFAAGDDLAPVVELCRWRLGLLICYDVEFPEAVRRLAVEGADAVLVPTALMSPYTFVADLVTRVRAFENGLYVAYANYCGAENGLDYVGRSAIIGPNGEALARAGTEPALLHARLERAALDRARESLPYLAERRPELYGAPNR